MSNPFICTGTCSWQVSYIYMYKLYRYRYMPVRTFITRAQRAPQAKVIGSATFTLGFGGGPSLKHICLFEYSDS